MSACDIIVLGASAGGVEALVRIARGLPGDLPAALFVALHVPRSPISLLPEILSHAGPLPAVHPRDGQAFSKGKIFVAPPDRHLIVDHGVVRLGNGPRENGHRPAIDPLFRSAAETYGPRVVAVVLSGSGDDGTAGLQVVRSLGGAAVVQSPHDAVHPAMPQSALDLVGADACLPVAEIPRFLVRAAREGVVVTSRPSSETARRVSLEEAKIVDDIQRQERGERTDSPSVFTCPDCGGVLWEEKEGKLVRYVCHVGHAYSPESLAAEEATVIESALWSALRMFKERAMLARSQARRSHSRGLVTFADHLEERAKDAERHAQAIQDLLQRGFAAGPPSEESG